jgi:hypothetical protein
MKPTPSSLPDPPPVLAFGAPPDDVAFGGAGVIAQEIVAAWVAALEAHAAQTSARSYGPLGRAAHGV